MFCAKSAARTAVVRIIGLTVIVTERERGMQHGPRGVACFGALHGSRSIVSVEMLRLRYGKAAWTLYSRHASAYIQPSDR